MNKILVTGCAGLVGSQSVKVLCEHDYDVIGVDNFRRGDYFGEEGDTSGTLDHLRDEHDFEYHNLDILDDEITDLVEEADGVIHTAAQPSHPRSIDIPVTDFKVNVEGTLNLLEAIREDDRNTPFVFCSTNKVYGEMPNFFAYEEHETRYEPEDPSLYHGFDESLRIDQNKHTPFGVSKASADMYVQEYAKMYGVPAGVFRMGCITGSAAMAVEQHNWEPYFVKVALLEETLTLYGYKGKQVRDVIHARDLAELFRLYLEDPEAGGVYNIGGGRKNSISLLESIDLIEEITGKEMDYQHGPGREADHQWWISDLSRVHQDYPQWEQEMSVEDTFEEIAENMQEALDNGELDAG